MELNHWLFFSVYMDVPAMPTFLVLILILEIEYRKMLQRNASNMH